MTSDLWPSGSTDTSIVLRAVPAAVAFEIFFEKHSHSFTILEDVQTSWRCISRLTQKGDFDPQISQIDTNSESKLVIFV